MSHKIAIMTDTNSGISTAEAQALNITLLPMPVLIDGETYYEGTTIDHKEFYERMKNGADISTAQPSPGDLTDIWDKLLTEYDEVLHIPMSSGLSGSCETAIMFSREYDGRVHVVDNHRIAITMRQSVLEAKHLAEQGKSAAEIKDYLEKDGLEANIYVGVDTLEYLKKGGRVTAAAAAIGTVLNLKPVLQLQGGKLDAYKKVRGMKSAVKTIINGIQSDETGRFAGQKLTIRGAYSGDPSVGEMWKDELQKAFPEYQVDVDPFP